MRKTSGITSKIFFSFYATTFCLLLAPQITKALEGIFVGQFLSKEALAAYGIVAVYYIIETTIASIFAIGTQITVTKLLGQGSKKKARSAFFTSVVVALIASLILCIFVQIFAEQFCWLFGARDEAAYICPLAANFLRITSLAAPASIGLSMLPAVIQVDGGKKIIKASSFMIVASSLLGYCLNFYIFYGGLSGLAICYCVSTYLSFMLLNCHFFKKNKMLSYMPVKLNFHYLLNVIKVSTPDIIQNMLRLLRPILLNSLIVMLAGVNGLAAYSIFDSFTNVYNAFVSSLGQTSSVLTSMYYGERDQKEIRRVFTLSMKYVALIILPAAILTLIFSEQIVSWYTGEADVFDQAWLGIVFYACSLPLHTTNRICIKIVQATENYLRAAVLNTLQTFILPVAISYAFGYAFGILGVWMSFLIREVIQIAIFAAMLLYDKIAKKNKDKFINNYFVDPKRNFNCNLSRARDIGMQLKSLRGFLMTTTISEESQFFINLLTEEVVYNLLNYDKNSTSNKKYSSDLRFIVLDNEVIVRFRDNSDPEYTQSIIETLKSKEGLIQKDETNFHISLVGEIIKNVDYVYALNFNNIIIKIDCDDTWLDDTWS